EFDIASRGRAKRPMQFIQHQHRTQAVVPTRCRHAPPRGPRASTQATPYQLTVREFEVLVLLCEGLRNAAIAARLFRSVRTIDHHLAAVFAKLNVCSRTEAVPTALPESLPAPEL